MIEYFKSLNVETYFLFVLGVLFSYYYYRKSKVNKLIKVHLGESISLLQLDDSLDLKDFKIVWKERQINNIYQVYIFLKNSGSISLKQEDFLKPFTIYFTDKVEILSTKILSSSNYTKIDWKEFEKDRAIQLFIKLMERNKLILIEITYSNDKVSPIVADFDLLDGKIGRLRMNYIFNINYRKLFTSAYILKIQLINYSFVIINGLLLPIFYLLNFECNVPTTFFYFLILPISILSIVVFVKEYLKIEDIKRINEWTEYKSKTEDERLRLRELEKFFE